MTSKKVKVNPKLAIVQDVIHLMDASDISEISFEQAGVKIHLRRGPGMSFPTAAPAFAPAPVMGAPMAAPQAAPAAAGPVQAAETGSTQNSPMVGTFYRASSPEAK